MVPVSEKTLFKSQSKDGKPNEKVVGIGIYAKSGASTVELSKKIKERIKIVQKTLPDGLKLDVSFDRATYINAAINEVYKTSRHSFCISRNNYLFVFRQFKSSNCSRGSATGQSNFCSFRLVVF